MRTRIFIDYWNFQINWQRLYRGLDRDWGAVPNTLIQLAQDELDDGMGQLQLEETRVYASYDTGRPGVGKFKAWLGNYLDKRPGVRVFSAERRWRERPVHCRWCDKDNVVCGHCNAKLGRASEKTVDARIVTDMMALAWEGGYEVAILVSSDGDFVPAVEKLQTKNIKVINAAWHGVGNKLAQACWASFEMDQAVPRLRRT